MQTHWQSVFSLDVSLGLDIFHCFDVVHAIFLVFVKINDTELNIEIEISILIQSTFHQ